MIWLLFALNLVGFAAAEFYFRNQDQGAKAETEAVDYSKTYGANVKQSKALFDWGVQLVLILRGRN